MRNSLENISVINEKGAFQMSEIMNDFKQALFLLLDKNVILQTILFGSYARQTANIKSDIDICLIYDEYKIKELEINIIVDNISESLLDKYGVIINALCIKKSYFLENYNKSDLFLNIKKEGILCQ